MSNFPIIGFILLLSIIVQATAAILAIRLIGITGKPAAWILIALSLTLMAIRRIVPLFRLIIGDQSFSPDPVNEIIGLVLSISMAIGIAFIAPLFIARKDSEEKIRRFNQELEQRVAQRTTQLKTANKELEDFTYAVAHDLRAPLRSIDGFCQILIEEYHHKLNKQGKNYLMRVRAAAQRMAQLIDDMLSLSHISRDEMNIRQVDLSEIAFEIADNLNAAEPERKVKFLIQKGIEVKGDGRLLRIVLENLIENAWKFTSKNLKACIEFGMMQKEDKKVYFVRDDGVGFDMKYVQKLFVAFQRLHDTREFPGTGIGLVKIQRIVYKHGGTVWAEGELQKGATFYFTLS